MKEHSLRGVRVGDKLVSCHLSYQRDEDEVVDNFVVTAVARKYLTAVRAEGWPNEIRFHLDTGVQHHGANEVTHYLRTAYTPEGWAIRLRRQDAAKRLLPFRRGHNFNDLTTDQLERMAAIYEEGK